VGTAAPPPPAGCCTRPLPPSCISYGNYCAYPGTPGKVDGPSWVEAALVGPQAVRVRWRGSGNGPSWPPPEEYVVRAYRFGPEHWEHDYLSPWTDPAHLTQVRLPLSELEYTFTGLIRGAHYAFCVWELNHDGIGGTCGDSNIAIAPAPSTSPTTTAPATAPATTPATTPTETPSDEPAPTATVTPA
jgi:hypothetical protein